MKTAVLLMAYGSPRTAADVGPYLADIRGGREPSEHAVRELESRYARIGGTSPLLDITLRQAAALQTAVGLPVYVGMKHWHPYVREAVERIVADGVERVVALALAPHYAGMSIGGYQERLERARAELGGGFSVTLIRSWFDEPAFVDLAARNVRAALADWDDAHVLFTAHSLPQRILSEGDPYVDELRVSAKLIADRASVQRWELAFQSASPTGEPWIGPDVLDRLPALTESGVRRVVIAPIGFVADHLEILFDVDVLFAELAGELGIELRRVASPNDDPLLAEALATAVRKGLR